jgi:hypothetical protein
VQPILKYEKCYLKNSKNEIIHGPAHLHVTLILTHAEFRERILPWSNFQEKYLRAKWFFFSRCHNFKQTIPIAQVRFAGAQLAYLGSSPKETELEHVVI